ncbi:unnamed protein product [Phytophthora fragariaefolia]|uniref:Unnamed protein product n=1 Tax=Phytophthora fragariaefolia TaxID=1490495 RepID=A0A9W7D6L7_9STRA|nr:unnamed protein product [Phytophthora fragariaefolia]
MRPTLPTDFALRRDLLRAQSFGDMLDVLRANTAEPPSSTKELAELRVQNAKLTRDNQGLLRRLESALASSTRFEHDLATVVRERDEWKRQATKPFELVASFRNTVCVLELQLRESTRQANRRVDSCQQLVDHLRRMVDQDLKRMSDVLAERDVAYSALQGVASSYFEQVQEAAAVISSGEADRALRFANQTIDNQRRVILRQKNVLRHHGRISVADPALALAAAAGIDAPGLSPGDLALNARLQWSRVAEFGSGLFAAELGRADFQYVGCWVVYDSRRLPRAVGGASSSPWEPIPPRPLNPGDPAVGARSSVESRSLLGVFSVGCLCHKLGGFGVLHGCDSSAGIDGPASSRCFRWLGEFYPVVDSADFAAGDQGFRWVDIQVSAPVSSQGCCWVISSSAA